MSLFTKAAAAAMHLPRPSFNTATSVCAGVLKGCKQTQTSRFTGTVGGLPFAFFQSNVTNHTLFSKSSTSSGNLTSPTLQNRCAFAESSASLVGSNPTFTSGVFKRTLATLPPVHPHPLLSSNHPTPLLKFPKSKQEWRDIFAALPLNSSISVSGSATQDLLSIDELQRAIQSGNITSITFSSHRELTRAYAIGILAMMESLSLSGSHSLNTSIKLATDHNFLHPSPATTETNILEGKSSSDIHLNLLGFTDKCNEALESNREYNVIIPSLTFDDEIFMSLTNLLIAPDSFFSISLMFGSEDRPSSTELQIGAFRSVKPVIVQTTKRNPESSVSSDSDSTNIKV